MRLINDSISDLYLLQLVVSEALQGKSRQFQFCYVTYMYKLDNI